MRGVVGHPKALLDERRDAFGRPDLTDKAERGCASGQCLDQLCPLPRGQARGRARCSSPPQSINPTFATPFDPLTDGALRHPQRCCNRCLLPARLVQFPAALSSSFTPIGWLLLALCWHDGSVPYNALRY